MHFKVPWVQSVSVASSSDRFKISSPRSSCYFALQMVESKYKWFSMTFVFCSIPDILQTWMEQYILVKCERSIPSEHIPIYHHNIISHRIHVWYIYIYIYANIWGILMGSMSPYIAAPWILWVCVLYYSNLFHPKWVIWYYMCFILFHPKWSFKTNGPVFSDCEPQDPVLRLGSARLATSSLAAFDQQRCFFHMFYYGGETWWYNIYIYNPRNDDDDDDHHHHPILILITYQHHQHHQQHRHQHLSPAESFAMEMDRDPGRFGLPHPSAAYAMETSWFLWIFWWFQAIPVSLSLKAR